MTTMLSYTEPAELDMNWIHPWIVPNGMIVTSHFN